MLLLISLALSSFSSPHLQHPFGKLHLPRCTRAYRVPEGCQYFFPSHWSGVSPLPLPSCYMCFKRKSVGGRDQGGWYRTKLSVRDESAQRFNRDEQFLKFWGDGLAYFWSNISCGEEGLTHHYLTAVTPKDIPEHGIQSNTIVLVVHCNSKILRQVWH